MSGTVIKRTEHPEQLDDPLLAEQFDDPSLAEHLDDLFLAEHLEDRLFAERLMILPSLINLIFSLLNILRIVSSLNSLMILPSLISLMIFSLLNILRIVSSLKARWSSIIRGWKIYVGGKVFYFYWCLGWKILKSNNLNFSFLSDLGVYFCSCFFLSIK